MKLGRITLFLLVGLITSSTSLWGFYGHRLISSMAIYTLPSELIGFYKKNADIIIDRSVVPDQRRYVVPEEGPRHYIDLDNYDYPDSIPKYWQAAVERYGEEFLEANGHGPWFTYFTYKKLITAFKEKDQEQIIRLSSDLAHYIADANVPLHTTSNYNGQQTDQHGIHGFWETRLPQLFSNNYDFLVGKAEYIMDPQGAIWDAVFEANELVDSVFLVEHLTTEKVGEAHKYSYEDRGRTTKRVYSKRYSKEYHEIMPQVEKRMQRSVKMIGDFWFTAWIEAGQPDLLELPKSSYELDSAVLKRQISPARSHEF